MWESRVLRRAFERLELHEGKLSRAVLRGGGGGDVTSLPDTWVGNHPGLPGQWSSSGQELVSERRQGVLVGSLVDLQPVLLLGRDVAGSPQSTYRTRQQAGLVLHHREPEVAHLALRFGRREDVLRFQIAVNDPPAMEKLQGFTHLGED